jgi:hypothetical protein
MNTRVLDFLLTGERMRADLWQAACEFATRYDRYCRPIEEKAKKAMALRHAQVSAILAEMSRLERVLGDFARADPLALQTPEEIRSVAEQGQKILAALRCFLEVLRSKEPSLGPGDPAEAICSPEQISRFEALEEEIGFFAETIADGLDPELRRRVEAMPALGQ